MQKILFLSIRFLVSRRTNLLLIFLIAICLGCLITVSSVAHGFSVVTAKQSKSIYSDITIEIPNQILGVSDTDLLIKNCEVVEGVAAASAYITGRVLFTDEYGQDSIGTIIGVDWEREIKVSELKDKLIGDVKAPECFQRHTQRGALFGKAMDYISKDSLITIFAKEGSIVLENRGYFKTGITSWDFDGILVSIETAQILFGARDYVPEKYRKMSTGVRIKVKENYSIQEVKEALNASMGYMAYGVVQVKDYRDNNKIEIQAMESYEKIIQLVLILMVFMITFSIFIPVHSMVQEKSKDIGILKSLGASKGYVFVVFLLIGVLLGLISTILGLPLGFLISNYLNQILNYFNYNPFPPDIFYVDELPIVYHYQGILSIVLFINVIATLASIVPAIRAARMRPIDLLR